MHMMQSNVTVIDSWGAEEKKNELSQGTVRRSRREKEKKGKFLITIARVQWWR